MKKEANKSGRLKAAQPLKRNLAKIKKGKHEEEKGSKSVCFQN